MGRAAKRKAGRYGHSGFNPKKKSQARAQKTIAPLMGAVESKISPRNSPEQSVLKLLPEEILEIYPIAMFLEEFTFEELKLAVEEYLSIHNFKSSGLASPQLKGVASQIEFTDPDYPVDMADALSTMAFASWLKDKPKTEKSARKFTQTVCSIAKGMYYLHKYSGSTWAKIEDAFESAIELQYALFPDSEKLKQ
ncbi:MAG: hypothetical protein QNJ54_23510 [Prochloraceae cyanobacterium]|nr:hypothetical protein [Prochloraceae cyanobacterium]